MLSESRTWIVCNYGLLLVQVCVTNEIVIRSQKVQRTAQHATNKSVWFIMCRNFGVLNVQAVSKSLFRPRVRILFALLPIRENAVIFSRLPFINRK